VTPLGTNLQLVVRLAEIDSPECNQPYHKEAKDLLLTHALGRDVIIRYKEINYFPFHARIVAWVQLPDGGDVSRMLLEHGLAWHNVQHSVYKAELERASGAPPSLSQTWIHC
jgi:endonuclease YncB( thermonuclease family)